MSYTIDYVYVSDGVSGKLYGGMGFVCWKVTLSGGQWAWPWISFQGPYSMCPAVAPDGTARSQDASGVYLGIDTLSTYLTPVANWAFAPPGLGYDTSLGDPEPGGYSSGFDSDAAAILEVEGTATDSTITSAISSALSGGSMSIIPMPITAVISSLTSINVGDVTPITGIITNSDTSGAADAGATTGPMWASSDPAVADISGTGFSPDLIGVATGTCVITFTIGSPAASPYLEATTTITVS